MLYQSNFFITSSDKCYLKKRIGSITFDMLASDNADCIEDIYNKILCGELLSDIEVYESFYLTNKIPCFFDIFED